MLIVGLGEGGWLCLFSESLRRKEWGRGGGTAQPSPLPLLLHH